MEKKIESLDSNIFTTENKARNIGLKPITCRMTIESEWLANIIAHSIKKSGITAAVVRMEKSTQVWVDKQTFERMDWKQSIGAISIEKAKEDGLTPVTKKECTTNEVKILKRILDAFKKQGIKAEMVYERRKGQTDRYAVWRDKNYGHISEIDRRKIFKKHKG